MGTSSAAAALAVVSFNLEQLQASGADGFDPVRFQFLLALTARAGNQKDSVQQILAAKAEQFLRAYETDLAATQTAASGVLDAIRGEFPAASASAEQLFQDCDFNALRRLAGRLQRAKQREASRTSLAGLSRQLVGEPPAPDQATVGVLLDEYLQQQERQILQSLTIGAPVAATATGSGSTLNNSRPAPAAPELRANRKLRQRRQKQGADNLVNRAIQASPASPGPLNPQMLTIRALTLMRDLSPHYLSRFVSYIDTLRWLEQADVKKAAPKPAKSKAKGKRKKARAE